MPELIGDDDNDVGSFLGHDLKLLHGLACHQQTLLVVWP
jgi:hypothetical protein